MHSTVIVPPSLWVPHCVYIYGVFYREGRTAYCELMCLGNSWACNATLGFFMLYALAGTFNQVGALATL